MNRLTVARLWGFLGEMKDLISTHAGILTVLALWLAASAIVFLTNEYKLRKGQSL